MMIKYYLINGQYTPVEEAKLHVSDLSILRGYSAFDFFLVKKGKPIFFDDYIDRFLNSVELLGLDAAFTRGELKKQVMDLLARNGQEEASMRLLITGGYALDGFSPAKPNYCIMQYPLYVFPEAKAKKGIKLLSFKYHRTFPEIKSTNYLIGISHLAKLKEAGAEELLFHDGQFISETTRSNVFMVTADNKMVTPAEGILKGITRKKILEIAKDHFEVEERQVTLEELKAAKEVFLSSTVRAALPIIQIDDQRIGKGVAGPISQKINDLLEEFKQNYLRNGDTIE